MLTTGCLRVRVQPGPSRLQTPNWDGPTTYFGTTRAILISLATSPRRLATPPDVLDRVLRVAVTVSRAVRVTWARRWTAGSARAVDRAGVQANVIPAPTSSRTTRWCWSTVRRWSRLEVATPESRRAVTRATPSPRPRCASQSQGSVVGLPLCHRSCHGAGGGPSPDEQEDRDGQAASVLVPLLTALAVAVPANRDRQLGWVRALPDRLPARRRRAPTILIVN